MRVQLSYIATAVLLTASMGFADTKVERSQLPPAVEKTVQQETQGATIKGFSKETENGVLEYEAETVVNGHTRDLAIGKDGTLLEVEEEVALDSLSQPVQSALAARAHGAKITKVEALHKKGALVAYEAATLKGTHHGEIQVGPEGQALSHEE
jgi:hypothetical protein